MSGSAFPLLPAALRVKAPRATVLMTHAAGFNAGSLRPFAVALAARAEKEAAPVDVFALEFQGHGARHASKPDALRWGEWASEDVLHALSQWPSRDEDVPLVGVGMSMGATALMQARLAGPEAGAPFRAIVGFEPIVGPAFSAVAETQQAAAAGGAGSDSATGGGGGGHFPPNPLYEATLLRPWVFRGAADAKRTLAGLRLLRGAQPDVVEAFVDGSGTVPLGSSERDDEAAAQMPGVPREELCALACDPAWEAWLYRGGNDLWRQLGRLPARGGLTLVGGERSPIPAMAFGGMPGGEGPSAAEAMAMLVARAAAGAKAGQCTPELRMVAGAAHLLPFSHPAECADIVWESQLARVCGRD